ncbi:MAG: SprB repeat-containing protein, partial [Bacteroidota bacterium]
MQTDTVCFGGSIAIGGGQIIHDSTGVYVDTIKIGATNCDSIIITDLTVLPELQLEIVQTAPAIGAAGMDGEATATATGGSGNYTITWCDGSTGPMNTNLVAGANCCVNVMDDQGCSYDTCFVVDFVEPFEPFDRFSEPLCQGDSTGSLTFGIRGGRAPYLYTWENVDQSLLGAGTFAAEGDSLVINDLPAGTYTIRIIDAFFDSTFQVAVTEPALLTVSIDEVFPISCFQACDGDFTITTAGGTGVRDLQITSPVGGYGCAGLYVFTVTDENGCIATVSEELIEPEEFIVSAASVSDVNCFAGSDGSIELITNGTPIAYAWEHGPMAAAVNNLSAGLYTVTVTNADGCLDTFSQLIVQPDAPLLVDIAEVNPITCAVDADGILQATASGGFGAVSYNWSNGQTTPTAINLGPGTYNLEVQDARGCTFSTSYTLTAPPPLNARL